MNDDDDVMSLGEGDGEEVEEQMISVSEDMRETHLGVPPSRNEIRLGRKVLDLERERDNLVAELEGMKARYPNHSTTIPVLPELSTTTPVQPITIPHELLPTMNLLRRHIADLTRDNQALRYTFLDEGESSGSNITLDTPKPVQASTEHGRVDLQAVVRKVREIMRENEELGDMILEAGKGRGAEWQKAIDDSKAIIESLESDLAHHLSVVQSVRSELVAYKTHFGPIPKPGVQSVTPISAATPAVAAIPVPSVPKLSRAGSISTSGTSSRHDRRRDSDRYRDKDRDRSDQKHGDRRHDRVKEESDTVTRDGERVAGGAGTRRGGKESDRDRDYKRRR